MDVSYLMYVLYSSTAFNLIFLLISRSFAIGNDPVEGQFMSAVGAQTSALNWDAKNHDFRHLVQGKRIK